MPGLHRYLVEGQCYHTISVTEDRLPIFHDSTNSTIVLTCLHEISKEKAYVLAYALMPDHLHLLLVPRAPHELPKIMQSIKGFSSREINKMRSGRGRIWQPSYYDRVVRTKRHLRQVVEYIQHNPVAMKLVDLPEGYVFSSAHPSSVSGTEAWLNDDRRGWKASATAQGS